MNKQWWPDPTTTPTPTSKPFHPLRRVAPPLGRKQLQPTVIITLHHLKPLALPYLRHQAVDQIRNEGPPTRVADVDPDRAEGWDVPLLPVLDVGDEFDRPGPGEDKVFVVFEVDGVQGDVAVDVKVEELDAGGKGGEEFRRGPMTEAEVEEGTVGEEGDEGGWMGGDKIAVGGDGEGTEAGEVGEMDSRVRGEGFVEVEGDEVWKATIRKEHLEDFGCPCLAELSRTRRGPCPGL